MTTPTPMTTDGYVEPPWWERMPWLHVLSLLAAIILAVVSYRFAGVASVAQDSETRAEARADSLESQINDTAEQQLCRVSFADEDFRLARVAEATFRRALLKAGSPEALAPFREYNVLLQAAADKAIADRIAAPLVCQRDPGARPTIALLPPIPE